MLRYETPAGTAEIENCWGDLSPLRFVGTVALVNRFLHGEFDLVEYRLRLLEMLTGYKRKNTSAKFYRFQKPLPKLTADTINENLYLISENLNFAVLPKTGPEEVLEFFSPDLREELKTRFVWEIHEPHFKSQLEMMKGRLVTEYDVNFKLGRNLMPQLRMRTTVLQGPVFNVDEGDIETNMIAGDYLDAQEYFMAYTRTKRQKYLDMMIMELYAPVEGEPTDQMPDFTAQETKEAALMLFIYIQQTLITDPVFSLLFNRGEAKYSNKLYLGPDEAIGQMVSAGFGTHESITRLDIRTFLNYQILILKKNVATLRSAGKKITEIANELNLPVETIHKL